jgi:hypothetical protein
MTSDPFAKLFAVTALAVRSAVTGLDPSKVAANYLTFVHTGDHMKKLVLAPALVAIAVFASGPAHALQYLTGHIVVLESTYMPNSISLQLDVGNTACPAGRWLQWKKPGTMEATYSTMLAALLALKKVDFIINDNDSTCEGQFFHIWNMP